MFTLAHISDIHLGPLPDISYRELASKRITGYVNWRRNRRKLILNSVTDTLVADMCAKTPDHIAVTGDLVNLALDKEIELARLWLEDLGPPDRVSVVPGNHDAYVPGALVKAFAAWGPFMTSDGETGPVGRFSFPYLRVRESVALIGVTSARATAPFMANGFFRERQAEKLGRLLDRAHKEGLFRVVMIHHPPVRDAAPSHKRLLGIDRFQRVVRRHGAELVLHGHTHLPSLYWIDGLHGKVPVVGVSAAGQGASGHKPAAQYNMFEISGESGAWQLTLSRRGYVGTSVPFSAVETVELSAGQAASQQTLLTAEAD